MFLAARGATLSVEREPKHLLLRGGQNPANLLLWDYTKGFCASAFDVAISDTLQHTSLDHEVVVTSYIA